MCERNSYWRAGMMKNAICNIIVPGRKQLSTLQQNEKTITPARDEWTHLKSCLAREVIRSRRPFSWRRVIHRVLTCPERRWYFWYRLWRWMWLTRPGLLRKVARKRYLALNRKWGCDIAIDAEIGEGLSVGHFPGVVIRGDFIAGKNLRIRQNTTIGIKSLTDEPGMVYIGDNVDIGANSCIIGNISIGDNVIIGAMSFINKDIPPDTLVYTRKETTLIRQKCGMT